MSGLNKSTIVRIKNAGTNAFFRYGEYVAPRYVGRVAKDVWFTAPPRMADLPLPAGGEKFEVVSQGAVIRGRVWGDGPIAYLMHGWGGRGSQFGAIVEPLLGAGFRVVMLDAPAHGDSDRTPGRGRTSNGVDFGRALDDVAARFGPAEVVIAHSLGTIATYLTLRFGWIGPKRLVFIAPMVEAMSLFDAFQAVLRFGPRVRRAFDEAVLSWVGVPVEDFDARVQARYSDPVPTLVFADRSDRQTPYDDAAHFAQAVDATLVTTEGLGHRRILRDQGVIAQIVEFVAPAGELEVTA